MTIQLPPNRVASSRNAFTLIELLIVIGIIGLLISITIPIYSIVNEGTNSARSVANLKSIGTVMKVYSAENANNLPVVESEEQLDWTDVDIDLEIETVETLPNWVQELMLHAADAGSDVTERVFSCPGIRWRGADDERLKGDDILLAYGATEAMHGFDEDRNLSEILPRNVATIENQPNTILVCETQQDGSEPYSYAQVTWSEAERDFTRPKVADAKVIDFRFKKAVNCLMADGSARNYRQKDGKDIEEPNWTGDDYESLK